MGTSLKLVCIIMLFAGAHLTIPKIVATAAALSTVTPKGTETAVNHSFIDDTLESSNVENVLYKAESDNSYEPPNNGGPDSQHGSGTR